MPAPSSHIGVLRETPLHASIKAWYTEPGDEVEVAFERFVIDIVRDDLLIEIQTRALRSMRSKLDALLDAHRFRIVHPIATARTIVKIDDGGEVVSRRRSPKRGRAEDIFSELVSMPTLIDHPNLAIDLPLISEDEVRQRHDTKGRRRGGWTVVSRSLTEVHDVIRIESGNDLGAMLPDSLEDGFTTAELAETHGVPRRLAQQMTYCLRHLGQIRITDKRGNALVYERS